MRIVEQTINNLLVTNPFYAHFFLNCEIQYDTYKISTAGVMITSRSVRMVFNTEFVNKLTVQELSAVIEHEVLHILFDHISAHKRDKSIIPKIANIAMDCTINQYLTNLPDGCITIEAVEKAVESPLERFQTWEYYYSKIMNSPAATKAMQTLDDHGSWEEGDDESSSLSKAIARSVAESALKAAKGQAPQAVRKALDAMRDGSKTPWQQILANFVSRATSSSSKNTRKKTNRRFGIDQPGKIKLRELTLGVCCDSSGSISDESYMMFMTELQRISQYCKKVYVIDCDSDVQNVTTLKKGQKIEPIRYGNGGTVYQPGITKCTELKVDAIVFMGDFDSSDTPANPGVPFLWVGVGDQPPPANFGSVLRLT